MPWTLVDSAAESDALMELYAKDGLFMIRANGLELMNGFRHDSETALGVTTAGFARSAGPRILVGGLGLGYTIAALVGTLGNFGTVTVAELSATVIVWFHRHIKASVLPEIPDNLVIAHADVADLLVAEDRYDVVVLDTDNGPEPLVTAQNGALYSIEGLKALHACLSAEGVALLWSGFKSAAFEASAERAGFRVECEPFERARADLFHYTYILAKNRLRRPAFR